MLSTLAVASVMSSLSQRRPRAIDATSVARFSAVCGAPSAALCLPAQGSHGDASTLILPRDVQRVLRFSEVICCTIPLKESDDQSQDRGANDFLNDYRANSQVVVMARAVTDLGDLPSRSGWRRIEPKVVAWTDDYSDILRSILRKELGE
jgi:hypothetical protein